VSKYVKLLEKMFHNTLEKFEFSGCIVLQERLCEAGLVDEGWMPVGLTNAERGVLAFQLAVRLDIQNQWQVFASLWGTTPGTLRSAYNKANEQRKTMSFVEKLNIILR